MNTSDPQFAPVYETVQHKTDVLDLDAVSGQFCDMEFRPTLVFYRRHHFSMLRAFTLASLVTGPVAWGVGHFVAPLFGTWHFLVGTAFLSVACAAVSEFARLNQPRACLQMAVAPRTILFLLAPVVVWLSVVLVSDMMQPSPAFSYLLLIGVPTVLVTADRIATHAVFWMTAGRRIVAATLHRWRTDWRQRYTTCSTLLMEADPGPISPLVARCAALKCRNTYILGPIWLLAAIVWPSFFVMAITPSWHHPTIGLRLVIASLIGLLFAGFLRSRGEMTAFVRLWYYLLHWFHYGHNQPMPPWMFRSPCGPAKNRRLLIVFAVCLLAVPLFGLSANGFWHLATADLSEIDETSIEDGTSSSRAATSLSKAASFLNLRFVLMLVAAIVYLSLVTPVTLLLAVFVAIGPLLSAYHNALEIPEE